MKTRSSTLYLFLKAKASFSLVTYRDPKICVAFENVEVLCHLFLSVSIFLGDYQGIIHLRCWFLQDLLVFILFVWVDVIVASIREKN